MSSFGPETSVVWMAAEPPEGARCLRLLWPVWVYTVFAPRPTARPETPLDAFQRAVLRLYRAGVRDPIQVASYLHLDRRLAVYIDTGLRDLQLCTGDRVLTEKGERVLAADDAGLGEVSQGFVFQDPDSRKLWPRFVEEFDLRETERSRGQVTVDIGSVERPRSVAVTRVTTAHDEAEESPSARRVLTAIRDHQRDALRAAERLAPRERRDDDQDGEARRVTVFPEPMAAWLGIVVAASGTERGDAAWEVLDPFGIGRSPFTHRLIDARAREHQGLRRALEELVAAGPASKERDALAELQLAVDRAVDRGSNMARAKAVARTQQVLELALAAVLPPGGDVGAAVDLSGVAECDGPLLEAHAMAIGFTSLPPAMRDVSLPLIRATLRGRTGSLRRLVVANLLCAARDPEHVFHTAAHAYPSLLTELDGVATMADESARADARLPEAVHLLELYYNVLDWVPALQPTPQPISTEAA